MTTDRQERKEDCPECRGTGKISSQNCESCHATGSVIIHAHAHAHGDTRHDHPHSHPDPHVPGDETPHTHTH